MRKGFAVRIGLHREIKDGESRVALTPAGVGGLVRAGHEVAIGLNLGVGVGFSDQEYENIGAKTGKLTHEFLARDTGRAFHPL